MIAGTPTSVGTIVDVEEQTGQYLIAVEKAELAVEVCEAPIASTKPVVEPEPADSDEVDFSEMTNLSKGFRQQLEQHFQLLPIFIDTMQKSNDGTIKRNICDHS